MEFAKTIASTSTQVVPINDNRQFLLLKNVGTLDMWISQIPETTISNGMEFKIGEAILFTKAITPTVVNKAIYARVASGSGALRVMTDA